MYEVSGIGINPEGEITDHGVNVLDDFEDYLEQALLIMSLCNNSSLNFNEEENRWEATGDPTEVALEVAARKVDCGKSNWLDRGYEPFMEIPFDSTRKRMTVVYTKPESGGVLLAKGALGAILGSLNACRGDLPRVIFFA